jgi:anti-sigma factor RsiW
MMGEIRCRWVRARLPLLASLELVGFERRQVERHLIGCPECRQRRAMLSETLEVLHTAGALSPTKPDAPSLWPALALQIRESRRPVSAPDLGLISFTFGGFRLGLGPALLGLSLVLGSLVVLGVTVRGRPPQTHSRPSQVANVVPPTAPKRRAPVSSPKLPAPKREVPARIIEVPVVESSPTRSVDYDLEHGRPMPTDGPRDRRDRKPTY